jgi:Domain of unknown function (DUF4340)
MNARQLIVLAALAAVSVVATAAVMRTNATTVASDHRGELVIPALRTRAKELTGLTVRDGSSTMAIERRDNEFVAESGFPIKIDAIRDLVGSAAELTFEEARTADPKRYGELGLADPGGENAGKEIVFKAGSGDLADVIVGNRDTTVGSAGGGEFVRLKGAPQTWLVRGSVRLPSTQTAWYVPLDFDIKRNEIKKIELSGGDREGVIVVADPAHAGEFTLEKIPENHTPETFKISRLATPIDAFSFEDVRRRTAPAPADARRLTAETADGVRVTLASVGPVSDGWVQATVEATNDGKRDQANALAAKTANFEFRLPSQEAEVLGWTVKDLTAEPPPAPPPAPVGGIPGMNAPPVPRLNLPTLPGMNAPPVPGADAPPPGEGEAKP